MKITSGKYVDQFAIGVTWLRYPNVNWSIIFDFGLWYVEVSNDFEAVSEWYPYGLENSIRCDRCGSPNDVYPSLKDKDGWEYELVCDICIRNDEYMESLTKVKQKADKKKAKVKSKVDKSKSNEKPKTTS